MFGTDNQNDQNNNQGAAPAPASDPFTPSVPSPTLPSTPTPVVNPINDQTNFIETPVNQPSLASSTPKEMSQSNTKPDNEGLLQLKQEALQSLAPMVHKLDQTPEEKFKTLMMLIQASDNTDLVKDAYETAKQITDEKDRAQALIDVVNEINYFTQHSNSDKTNS